MGPTVRGVSRPRISQSRDTFYFSLQLDRGGNAGGIVDLVAEVGTVLFEFDVSRSELNRSQISRLLCRFAPDFVRRTECVP
jgi:hypothetical protein